MEYLWFLTLPFLAYFSANISQRAKTSNKYIFIPPLLAFCVGWSWIMFAKNTTLSLAVASVTFDAVYILCYFFAFIWLGEKVTILQGFGVSFIVLGIVLLKA